MPTNPQSPAAGSRSISEQQLDDALRCLLATATADQATDLTDLRAAVLTNIGSSAPPPGPTPTQPAPIALLQATRLRRRPTQWSIGLAAAAAVIVIAVAAVFLRGPQQVPTAPVATSTAVLSSTAVHTSPARSAQAVVTPAADDRPLPTSPQANAAGELNAGSWRVLFTEGTKVIILATIGGSCDTLDHIQVAESDTQITLTSIIRHNQAAGTPCTADLKVTTGYVILKAPVGSRTLVHGKL